MKKTILFTHFFLLLLCSKIFAQVPVGYGKDFINVKYDLGLFGLSNLSCNASEGAAAKLQAVIDYNHNVRHDSILHLYFPYGNKIKLDSTVYPQDNIIFDGADCISTSAAMAYRNVFEGIGHSYVKFWNCRYTNAYGFFINAFIQLKAHPNKCFGNEIINCSVKNTWASAAFMLANVQDTDSTYYLDNTIIRNDTVINCYNPSRPYMLTTDDYNTNADCSGINILNGNLKLLIEGCYFVHTGGDGIRGFGLGKAMSHNSAAGNIEIRNCYLERNNLNIEINGNYYPNNLYIHDNDLNWPTFSGGFSISCQGKGLRIIHNHMRTAEKALVEFSASDGMLTENWGEMVCWKDTSMGPKNLPLQAGSDRIWFGNFYGFNNLIALNRFQADRSTPTNTTPAEFDGFAIVGKASNYDTLYDRASYRNYTDLPALYTFIGNTLTGNTHVVMDAPIYAARNVNFIDNTVISNVMQGSPVKIHGDGWQVKMNTFDLTGSPAPTAGNKVVKLSDLQTTPSGAQVYYNTTYNSTWSYSTSFKNCGNIVSNHN